MHGDTLITRNGYRWRLDPSVSADALEPICSVFPQVRDLTGARVLKENRFRTVVQVPLGPHPSLEPHPSLKLHPSRARAASIPIAAA